jgi:sporulation protein YlmC with PRC-barrel domain
MTLFSAATGRQVVSTSTAVTLGKIDEFVIDPHARAIVAVTLKKTDGGDTLRWSDITAFGADAVTVAGADRLSASPPELAALSGKDHRILGKRVLATTGDELGSVDDVEFDPRTGAITALALTSGRVDGVHLIAVGSYAVVVRAD